MTTQVNRLMIFLVAAFAASTSGCKTASPPVKQSAFGSPATAVVSFVEALRSGSKEQLATVLGDAASEVLESGDAVADQQNARTFLERYDQSHDLLSNADGSRTLVVGNDKWPLPIPLVFGKEGWKFDLASGKDEILARRIGRNESNAIEVCLAIVDAQRDFAMMDPDGDGVHEYAQKIFSDEGAKNGLYWKASTGEPASPLGPLVAAAADEGYSAENPSKGAYHGYRYRVLKSQGASAPGGARDFVIGGKMIGGFALIAYPADYGNSGIMTFIVSHDGVVYQSDLGPDAARAALSMSVYDPSAPWTTAREK